MKQRNWKAWAAEHRFLLMLLAAIFVERVWVMYTLGADYNIANDDMAYMSGAIRFLQTGGITNSDYYPSALSMPGMTWVIAGLMKIFGQELAFWLSIKLLWILMGTATAFVTYQAVVLMAPKWCGLVAAGCFLAPNIAWMDNLVLTETPYFLCFTLTIYLTLLMGRTNGKGVFAGYCVPYMVGLLFRPTIVIMPAFSLTYLFLMKVDRKLLGKRLCIGIVVLMVFLVPWTVRNYIHFHHFIPLTAGDGNPMQEGTYQGFGYPTDEELDYETYVEQVWREDYAEYLDENGQPLDPNMEQFFINKKFAIKAQYRMRVWWENNPVSMLLSYLVIKPGIMLVKTFYWKQVLGTPAWILDVLRAVNFFMCCGAVFLCFRRKQFRMEIGFLTAVYWIYIYMISMTYSFSRYGETLMSLRYIIMAVGLHLLVQEIKERQAPRNFSLYKNS